MADEVSISIDVSKDALKKMRRIKEQTPIAICRALNHAGSTGKTFTPKQLKEDNELKKSIAKNLSLKKADKNNLSVSIIGKGENIGVTSFKSYKNTRNKKNGGKGASIKLRTRKDKTELIGNGTRSKAFVINLNGNKHIFQRKKNHNNKLTRVETVGVAGMMKDEKTSTEVLGKLKNAFEKRIEHEVDYLISTQK